MTDDDDDDDESAFHSRVRGGVGVILIVSDSPCSNPTHPILCPFIIL